MSDLDARKQGVRFEPVPAPPPAPPRPVPGGWTLILGVLLPGMTVLIELVSRMCARDLFDPMPTWAHAAAVGSVPAINLWIWMRLHEKGAKPSGAATVADRRLALASGFSLAVAAFYALLFLPIAPLALVALIFGVGVLPLAPLSAFGAAVSLARSLSKRYAGQRLGTTMLAGWAAGLALLVGLDVPSGATRLGVQWAASSDADQRARGIALLRAVGDEDLLLRLCYDSSARPVGLLSSFLAITDGTLFEGRGRQPAVGTAQVREIYYRVHGAPFNARPAPSSRTGSRMAFDEGWRFDADHGGASVGGRIQGLDIASSRIDGTIRADEATAYLEWTVEVRNTSFVDREARMQVLLPPGGVISRATLWVNGEEREAAYGGRGEVRAAYQRVAVQQRRDPLLVTSKGADRVLAQAFPVPRNGGTIKFKLGITAPLELTGPRSARLALPAIVDRNFSFASDVRHEVWIESRAALSTSIGSLTSARIDPQVSRILGPLDDGDLARTRAVVTIERDAGVSTVLARFGESETIRQEIVAARPAVPAGLVIVVDGSARMRAHARDVVTALEAVPPAAKVGVLIAAEPPLRLAVAPWTDEHKAAAIELIRTAPYRGGQDNAPALAEAMQMLEGAPQGRLLWVHGPQPIAFAGSAARMEQVVSRLARLPPVTLYATEPGPNEALPDAPWGWGARALPRTGAMHRDLAAFLSAELGATPRLGIVRAQTTEAGGDAAKGSDHVARLWARDRVLELMQGRQGPANRGEAVTLAAEHRLVTPVSGAVVLETRQQYEESGLTPVSQASVPAVPEPHEWALMLAACAALAWLAARNRRNVCGAV